MYEMQGTLPGFAAPGRPVAWPSRCRAPPARVRNPREAQVSPLLPRPGVASGQCPPLTVKAFLQPQAGPRKTYDGSFSGFLAVHMAIHRMRPVIRIRCWFSTVLCTARPQVTLGDEAVWPGQRRHRSLPVPAARYPYYIRLTRVPDITGSKRQIHGIYLAGINALDTVPATQHYRRKTMRRRNPA